MSETLSKRVLMGLVAWLALTGSATATTTTNLTAKQVAKWKIPGERELNHCMEYAVCLNVVLFERGVESRFLTYSHYADQRSGHAVLLFRIGDQEYIIDNERDTPVPVSGVTDFEKVRCFDRHAVCMRDEVVRGTNVSWDGQDVATYMKRLAKARAKGKY